MVIRVNNSFCSAILMLARPLRFGTRTESTNSIPLITRDILAGSARQVSVSGQATFGIGQRAGVGQTLRKVV